jgi:hypothetical protein
MNGGKPDLSAVGKCVSDARTAMKPHYDRAMEALKAKPSE